MRHLVLSFIALVACDSPGGRSGESPCLQDPNLPTCQRDTSTPDDVGPSDADDATTAADSALPDVDGSGPIECLAGLSRCDGNLVEQCLDGHWVATTQCTGTTACQDGACIAVECQNEAARCNADAAETCVDHRWQERERCEFGCADGACVPASCADIMSCLRNKGTCTFTPGDPCHDACTASADEASFNEFQAIIRCYDDQAGEGRIVECVPLEAACAFPVAGDGTCAALFSCAGNCTNNTCVETCYERASQPAQVAYLSYARCQAFCPGCFECTEYRESCIDN